MAERFIFHSKNSRVDFSLPYKGFSNDKELKNNKGDNMANKDFNIDAFIKNFATQAQDLFPDDIGDKTGAFILEKFDDYLRRANESIDIDKKNRLSTEDKEFALQVLSEWIFHKTIDLDRSKIPFEFWDSVLQNVAIAVFEVSLQGIKKNLEQQSIVSAIEYYVSKMYNKSLQDLFEKGVINKESLERAQKESNIDKMSEEYRQKKASEKENDITNTSFIGRLKSILQGFFK